MMPLAVAVVIGGSARSPFGETERTVSISLPVLRFGHLAGGLALAVLYGARDPEGETE